MAVFSWAIVIPFAQRHPRFELASSGICGCYFLFAAGAIQNRADESTRLRSESDVGLCPGGRSAGVLAWLIDAMEEAGPVPLAGNGGVSRRRHGERHRRVQPRAGWLAPPLSLRGCWRLQSSPAHHCGSFRGATRKIRRHLPRLGPLVMDWAGRTDPISSTGITKQKYQIGSAQTPSLISCATNPTNLASSGLVFPAPSHLPFLDSWFRRSLPH